MFFNDKLEMHRQLIDKIREDIDELEKKYINFDKLPMADKLLRRDFQYTKESNYVELLNEIISVYSKINISIDYKEAIQTKKIL